MAWTIDHALLENARVNTLRSVIVSKKTSLGAQRCQTIRRIYNLTVSLNIVEIACFILFLFWISLFCYNYRINYDLLEWETSLLYARFFCSIQRTKEVCINNVNRRYFGISTFGFVNERSLVMQMFHVKKKESVRYAKRWRKVAGLVLILTHAIMLIS